MRESVEVQVTVIGPDGQPVPNFMIYASDVNYSALTIDGETVGIKYRLAPNQFDPTYISVTAPVDFYNADATGQFITNANIEQRYSVQVSTNINLSRWCYCYFVCSGYAKYRVYCACRQRRTKHYKAEPLLVP